jgi:PHP family Zn ribbon phosphoesterase
MNRTLDEILTAYEDLWRQAALEDHKQMFAGHGLSQARGPYGSCAWLNAGTVGQDSLEDEAAHYRVDWRCPECGQREVTLACVMIHANNAHRWDWTMFANKFRDVLAEGSK